MLIQHSEQEKGFKLCSDFGALSSEVEDSTHERLRKYIQRSFVKRREAQRELTQQYSTFVEGLLGDLGQTESTRQTH